MSVPIDYASITKLDLSNKKLDVLPDLCMYVNLKKLYCNLNKITSLNNLPPNLEILYCSYNQITSLDNLPPNLIKLEYYGNPLIYDFEPTLENIRNYNASRIS